MAFRAITGELLVDGETTVVNCDATYESRQRALDELAESGMSAVVFAYSPDAITMLGLMTDRGLEVGADMSVVSFDDIAAFAMMTPSVSVISQQAETMGRQGVELLMRQLAGGGEAAGTQYVSTVFIARKSSSALCR